MKYGRLESEPNIIAEILKLSKFSAVELVVRFKVSLKRVRTFLGTRGEEEDSTRAGRQRAKRLNGVESVAQLGYSSIDFRLT